jgi:SIR2-like domain/Sir2- and TIR-associating SLOG family
MHGTVEHPSEVVIAKGDYENYRRTRSGFLHLLTGHLVSRHILVLGLSFTDPNLYHLFTVIREAFEETPPEHFAIVRIPKRDGYDTDDLFKYAKRRHDLWVDDLQNYGIQCVEVDEYDEIDRMLEAVERRLAMGSVMVSGSFRYTRCSRPNTTHTDRGRRPLGWQCPCDA